MRVRMRSRAGGNTSIAARRLLTGRPFMEGLVVSPAKMGTKMGMLKGEVVGEVMAVKIAEIGAQGEPCSFAIVSRDELGDVAVCEGSYWYMLDDGTVFEGAVRGRDLEKAIPAIERTGVARPFSMVRGHFKFEAADGNGRT